MTLKSFIPDWLLYGTIVIGMILYANHVQEDLPEPPPQPELGPLLPSESPRDERIIVQVDAPRSGVGTAFASNREGEWITARHVVDGCETVAVRIEPQKLLRVTNTEIRKESDLARLQTRWSREPLATDLDTPRIVGENGFFFGYPQGKPGEVAGRLLSRGRMQVRGRYRNDEGVLIWTELGRTGGLTGSLGGLSGGPVLDADGEVIGVVTAESPRRGRIYTVSPRNLRRILPETDGSAAPITVDDYALQADSLRRARRVAQIVCLARS